MKTPGDGDFLAGIDPVSAFRADVEAEVAIEVERQFLGDLSNRKPEGLSGFLGAMTGPAPGYTEVASEGGIHWHTRTDALGDRCTCTDAGGMVEVRNGRCTFCRKPYAD